VLPAVSQGRLVCLSTPFGKHGFFHDAWANGGDDWTRVEVRASQCPRITREFLDEERRCLSESYYRQEYECSFEALEGLVYPDFARCVVPGPAPAGGKQVGGIDFGFRNPFAAVWGTVDRDGVLWLGPLSQEHDWIVPIVLSSPLYGLLGQVGELRIDARTAEVVAATDRPQVVAAGEQLSTTALGT